MPTGHIQDRGKDRRGRYRQLVMVDLGRDPVTGKRIRRSKTVYGRTKRQSEKFAEQLLAQWLTELDQGSYVEPSELSLGNYLLRWLEHVRANLAPRTLESYEYIIKRHLSPALGHVPLAKLSPITVQNYYAGALRAGRKDGEGGLSNRTVQYHHAVLRRALGQAVRWRMLAQNPCDAVEPPRVGRHDITVLNEQQVHALLEAAAGTRDHSLIHTAVMTGLRRGELLGLRWADVDLSARVIRVHHALQRVRGEGLVLREPKTSGSRRQVSLLKATVDVLRTHQLEQKKARLKAGARYQDNDLVFCLPDGRPLDPPGLSRRFRKIADEAGFPTLRFHDLRHTHATLLLARGVHPKIVQDRLGHESITQTIDTYSHVLPDLQKQAADELEKHLFGGSGQLSDNYSDTP